MWRLKQFIHGTFQRMGWEVRRNSYPSSERLLLEKFLEAAGPDVVFDVGANLGQYALLIRKCGFNGRIVSFEAQPAVHAKLAAITAGDPNWIAAPCCALGRAPGQAAIGISENSLSSSLLPMLDTHLSAAPESRYLRSEEVRVKTLDELTPHLLPISGRLLLKIDTQGYEEEVLMGAKSTLDSVCAMQLEISVAPLYEGAPSMQRLLELAEQLGYELYGLMPGFYDQKTGRLLQVDGLFLRVR